MGKMCYRKNSKICIADEISLVSLYAQYFKLLFAAFLFWSSIWFYMPILEALLCKLDIETHLVFSLYIYVRQLKRITYWVLICCIDFPNYSIWLKSLTNVEDKITMAELWCVGISDDIYYNRHLRKDAWVVSSYSMDSYLQNNLAI